MLYVVLGGGIEERYSSPRQVARVHADFCVKSTFLLAVLMQPSQCKLCPDISIMKQAQYAQRVHLHHFPHGTLGDHAIKQS
jgi:hypothetical protein